MALWFSGAAVDQPSCVLSPGQRRSVGVCACSSVVPFEKTDAGGFQPLFPAGLGSGEGAHSVARETVTMERIVTGLLWNPPCSFVLRPHASAAVDRLLEAFRLGSY